MGTAEPASRNEACREPEMEADAGNDAFSSAPASDVVGDVPFGPPGASERGVADEAARPARLARLAAVGGLKADDGDEKVAAPDACGDAGRSDSGEISGRMAAGETTVPALALALAAKAPPSEATEPVGDTDVRLLLPAPYVLLLGSDEKDDDCDGELSAAIPAATDAGGGGDSARTPPAAATAADPVK